MFMKVSFKVSVNLFFAASILLVPKLTIAQVELTIGSEVRYDSNATRNEEDQQSEYQSVTSLSAAGDLKLAYATGQIDYSVKNYHFSEETQADDTKFFGDSLINFAEANKNFGLYARHRIDQVVSSSDADAVQGNALEQQLLELVASAGTREDKPFDASVQGYMSKVTYEDDLRSNAEQKGIGIQLRRNSKFFKYGINGKKLNNSFDESILDYELRRYGLFLNYASSKGLFELEVGRDKTDSEDGGDDTSAYQLARVEYIFNATSIEYEYNSSISDTSFSRGAEDLTNGVIVDGGANIQDRVEVNTHSLNLSRNVLCQFCKIDLRYDYRDYEFLNFSTENSQIEVLDAQWGMQLSTTSMLSVGYGIRTVNFSNQPERNLETEVSQLRYQRSLSRHISVAGYLRHFKRKLSAPYDTNQVGIELLARLP